MATRATIRFATREEGVPFDKHPDQWHAQFYNHWDGYPEGLGVTIADYLNGKKITTNTFEKYINLYVGTKKEHPRAYEKYNDRWEIAATINPYHSFENISFVNGINTTRGGKHVTNILNQITKKLY